MSLLPLGKEHEGNVNDEIFTVLVGFQRNGFPRICSFVEGICNSEGLMMVVVNSRPLHDGTSIDSRIVSNRLY